MSYHTLRPKPWPTWTKKVLGMIPSAGPIRVRQKTQPSSFAAGSTTVLCLAIARVVRLFPFSLLNVATGQSC
jgi:hypothetical protein